MRGVEGGSGLSTGVENAKVRLRHRDVFLGCLVKPRKFFCFLRFLRGHESRKTRDYF